MHVYNFFLKMLLKCEIEVENQSPLMCFLSSNCCNNQNTESCNSR